MGYINYVRTKSFRPRFGDPLARVVPRGPECPVTYDFGKCDVCLTHNIRDKWTHLRKLDCGAFTVKICQIHFDIEMVSRAAQGKPTFKWDELEPDPTNGGNI